VCLGGTSMCTIKLSSKVRLNPDKVHYNLKHQLNNNIGEIVRITRGGPHKRPVTYTVTWDYLGERFTNFYGEEALILYKPFKGN